MKYYIIFTYSFIEKFKTQKIHMQNFNNFHSNFKILCKKKIPAFKKFILNNLIDLMLKVKTK